MEGGREGGREKEREGGREGGREKEREEGREGEREREGEGQKMRTIYMEGAEA